MFSITSNLITENLTTSHTIHKNAHQASLQSVNQTESKKLNSSTPEQSLASPDACVLLNVKMGVELGCNIMKYPPRYCRICGIRLDSRFRNYDEQIQKHKPSKKNADLYNNYKTGAKFWGKPPFQSKKTTVEKQLNGDR